MAVREFAGHDELPLAVGSMTGLRAFTLRADGGIVGMYRQDHPWVDGENVAECPFDEIVRPVRLHPGILTNMGNFWIPGFNAENVMRLLSRYISVQLKRTTGNHGTTVEYLLQEHLPELNLYAGQVLPSNMIYDDGRNFLAPDHSLSKCTHGFYGYLDGHNDYLHSWSAGTPQVGAVVEGYGETLIGTRGFRSMKCRVVAVAIDPFATTSGIHFTVPGFEGVKERFQEKYPSVKVYSNYKQMVEQVSVSNEYLKEVKSGERE